MKDHELLEVWYDNVRVNQISHSDGITPEVAEQIGYKHPADLHLGNIALGSSTLEELESRDPAIGLTQAEANALNSAANAERGGTTVDPDLLR